MPTYRGCQGGEDLVRQEAKRSIQDPRIQQGTCFKEWSTQLNVDKRSSLMRI